MQAATNPKRKSLSENSKWEIRITQNSNKDVPLEYISNDVPQNNSELLDGQCRRHVLKTEPSFYKDENLEEFNSNQFYISSVQCGGQKIKVEPEDNVVFPTHNSDCLNEPHISQLIKAEPSHQEQEEEKFSLAEIVGHFQSPASTPSLHVEKHKESLNRNSDLSQETKKKNVTCAGEKHYSCRQCDKSFSNARNLIRHERTHKAEKPYSCHQYNKSSSQSSYLEKHKRTHTGDKPYSCGQCDKSFSESGKLVRHKRTHTGEKPYSCNQCNKSFIESWKLVRHKRTHTGEKPYSCDQCNKSFSQSSNLYKHKRTHTGDKPYSCDQCNKSFTGRNCRVSLRCEFFCA